MPAVITHYLHAKQVLKQLRRSEGMKLYTPAVLWGTQGPDFLFFHRAIPILQFGKSYRKIGSFVHRADPDALFNGMYTYYTKYGAGKNHLLSYIYGFLCHYAMDRTAHPFVYAWQKAYIEKYSVKYNPDYMHNKIESNLDIILLHKLHNTLPTNFNPASTFKINPVLLERQAALMTYTINRMMGKRVVKESKMQQAFLDMRRNVGYLHDPALIKRPIALAVEKILGIGPVFSGLMRDITEDGFFDYANTAHEAWFNPSQPDKERREDFFEIFELAVQDACSLILRFKAALEKPAENPDITDGIGFLTGVPVSLQSDLLHKL